MKFGKAIRPGIVFVESYFVILSVYMIVTCLLFDPYNFVAYGILGLSVVSGVLIYLKNRLGFYIGLLSTMVSFFALMFAFGFSIKFGGELNEKVYDASLALFSVLSIIAFVVIIDLRNLFTKEE